MDLDIYVAPSRNTLSNLPICHYVAPIAFVGLTER